MRHRLGLTEFGRVVLFGHADEGVLGEVPDGLALGVLDDDRFGERCEEASAGILKVLTVGEVQALPVEGVEGQRVLRRRFRR